MKNKKKKYSVIAIIIAIACSITVISNAKEKSFVNNMISNLKQSKQERIKKKEEKFKKKILDKLEKKYGEKFEILSEYDGDVFMGDMEEYVVVKNHDDSYRFRVKVDFDTYSVYGDTYMVKFLYPKYEEYVKKILYDKYGDKVTLDDIQMLSSGYKDTITKDTPIEEISYSAWKKMYPNMTLYVSEDLLKNSSPKEVSHDIAKVLGKKGVAFIIYTEFIKKEKYSYGMNLDKEYKEFKEYSKRKRDEEGENYNGLALLQEFNKKYYVFFSKHAKPYQDQDYWLMVLFDARKRKFYIDDMEENFLLDGPKRKRIYID